MLEIDLIIGISIISHYWSAITKVGNYSVSPIIEYLFPALYFNSIPIMASNVPRLGGL